MSEYKRNDWVVLTVKREFDGREVSFKQLGCVFRSSSMDGIRVATPLSVQESGHYLVTPRDELDKVELFDEPRRAGNTATYAQGLKKDILEPDNMDKAIAYFFLAHGIQASGVRRAFEEKFERRTHD